MKGADLGAIDYPLGLMAVWKQASACVHLLACVQTVPN